MRLLLALALVVAVQAMGNIETKPLSETKPTRYQLGGLIESDENDGVLIERINSTEYLSSADGMQSGTMLGKTISININPMVYRRTMVTIPIPIERKGDSNYHDLARNYGCVKVKFLAMEDLSNNDKIPEHTLVILANDLKYDLMTNEVAKNLHDKKVVLGFLKRFLPLEDACRKLFVDNSIGFIENLDLPEDFDLMAVVKSGKFYYGFKLIFSPFKNSTMIYRETKVEQHALVNLADFVLFEGDDRLSRFCTENKDKLVSFSHSLVSDKFPILSGFELPYYDFESSSNESMPSLRFSGQTGTSIIAPYRFDKSGSSIGNMSSDFFFSPCVYISVPCGDAVNFKVTKGHLEQWEKDKGVKIPRHSTILIDTGYWKKWDSMPEQYLVNYPGIDVDALKWLVEERDAVSIGIDSLSIDDYSLTSKNRWIGHSYLAGKNIPALVNLRFEQAGKFQDGSRCAFSYLRIAGGTSSPLALFGLSGYDSMGSGSKSGQNMQMSKKVYEEHGKSLVSGSGELSKRWQLGQVIRHKTDDCYNCTLRLVKMEVMKGYGDDMDNRRDMVFTETSLIVDPTINRLTTLTQPAAQPVINYRGCVETLFVKTTEMMSIKRKVQEKVKEGMFIIFLATDLVKLHDVELIKQVAAKKVCLGFFDDVELPSDIRNRLIEHGLAFFENLSRPKYGFNEASIDEDRIYYSFKFAFAPFKDETSLGSSLSMDPKRKINLADVVVFNDDAVAKRCSSNWPVVNLNRLWSPSDKIPIRANLSRPMLSGENNNVMTFFDHFGSHIDAPVHTNPSSKVNVEHLPKSLDRAVCLRVEISYGGKEGFSIGKQHFIDWESNAGMKIPEGSMVILDTGFGADNWNKADKYVGGFPGLAVDGARFLVEERMVVAIGIDSLLTDNSATAKLNRFPTHWYLAEKDIVAFENLGGDGFEKLSSDGSALCVMSYLRMENGGGSPVALFSMLGNERSRVETTTRVLMKIVSNETTTTIATTTVVPATTTKASSASLASQSFMLPLFIAALLKWL